MELALRWLGIFILADLIAAVALLLLVHHARRSGPEQEMEDPGGILGVLVFIGLCALLIYGGMWFCLRGLER